MRKTLLFLSLIGILCAFNWAVWQKEPLLRGGTVMYLEFAPVDPRALLLGDYMDLDYAINRDVRDALDEKLRREHPDPRFWQERFLLPREGRIVVTLSPSRVAEFVRLDDGTPLLTGEHLLHFRSGNGNPSVASKSFFFQEGHAADYQRAMYGEIHVDAEGRNLLTHMLDSELRRIVPSRPGQPGQMGEGQEARPEP